jgi:hypothetical protein
MILNGSGNTIHVCEIVCESSCVNLLGLGKNDIFECKYLYI